MIRSCDRFFDLLALTFPDPDHSGSEEREITIGHSIGGQLLFVSYFERGDRVRIISARSASSMKKVSAKRATDDLRPEYDISPPENAASKPLHNRGIVHIRSVYKSSRFTSSTLSTSLAGSFGHGEESAAPRISGGGERARAQ